MDAVFVQVDSLLSVVGKDPGMMGALAVAGATVPHVEVDKFSDIFVAVSGEPH